MLRQIVLPSGDIPDLGDNTNSFEKDRGFLADGP